MLLECNFSVQEGFNLGVHLCLSLTALFCLGYAPLLVRLVQLLGHNGISWSCIADTLRQLPGPVLEFTQSSTPEHLSEALERCALN